MKRRNRMKHDNIFDQITGNEDVSEVVLCAIHDFLEDLVQEFEISAFRRIKCSFEELNEIRTKNGRNTNSDDDPF
jgi:hypothetical protein